MSSVIEPPGMQDHPDAKQLLEMLLKGVSIPNVGSIDESTWMHTAKLLSTSTPGPYDPDTRHFVTRKVIESKSLYDEHINNVTSLLSLWYRGGHFTEASDCHRAIGEILARAPLAQSSDFSSRKITKIKAVTPSTDEQEAITDIDFRKTVKRDFENSDKGNDMEEDLSESGDAPVNASMHAGSAEAFDSGTEVVAVPSRKAVSAPTTSKGKKVASRKGKARKPMFDKGKAAKRKKASQNICARKPRRAQLQASKPVPTHLTAKDKLSEVMGDEVYVATQAETSSEDD